MVAAFIPYGVQYDLSIAWWDCCHHGLWASTLHLHHHHPTCGCFSALLQRRYCIIIKVNESVWGSTRGRWLMARRAVNGTFNCCELGKHSVEDEWSSWCLQTSQTEISQRGSLHCRFSMKIMKQIRINIKLGLKKRSIACCKCVCW